MAAQYCLIEQLNLNPIYNSKNYVFLLLLHYKYGTSYKLALAHLFFFKHTVAIRGFYKNYVFLFLFLWHSRYGTSYKLALAHLFFFKHTSAIRGELPEKDRQAILYNLDALLRDAKTRLAYN